MRWITAASLVGYLGCGNVAPPAEQPAPVVVAPVAAEQSAPVAEPAPPRVADGETSPWVLQTAAGAAVRAGDRAAALALVARAVDGGLIDAAQLTADPDLAALHDDPAWAVQLARVEEAAAQQQRRWNSAPFAAPYAARLTDEQKLAGLAQVWMEVKLNFVNFDKVPDLDWDATYVRYLPRVRAAATTEAYYRTLAEMVALLHDGHTNVYPPPELMDRMYARPALRTRRIEGRVFINAILDPALAAAGLAVGQEVVAIDGVAVERYAATRVAPYVSASTPQDHDVRTYGYQLLMGDAARPIKLTVAGPAGKPRTHVVPRLTAVAAQEVAAAAAIPGFQLDMRGNVAVVALRTFERDEVADQFLAAFERIAAADALVLDLRENGGGNSDVGFRILATLADRPYVPWRWYTRDYRPSYRAWGYGETTSGGAEEPLAPHPTLHFGKPVVLLVGPRTFSAAEDFAVAFDALDRGAIIGEATGGSTGQPLFFTLPGGGRGRVCTRRVLYPDGKEFIGVGVVPDRVVPATVAALRGGEDPVLAAALSELRRSD